MKGSIKSNITASDLKALSSVITSRRRRTKLFLYGFMFSFIACTAYLAFFNPSDTNALPWFNNLFASASASTAPYRSQISDFFSSLFPNSNNGDAKGGIGFHPNEIGEKNRGVNGDAIKNHTIKASNPVVSEVERKEDKKQSTSENKNVSISNPATRGVINGVELKNDTSLNKTNPKSDEIVASKNQTSNVSPVNSPQFVNGDAIKNQTSKTSVPVVNEVLTKEDKKQSKSENATVITPTTATEEVKKAVELKKDTSLNKTSNKSDEITPKESEIGTKNQDNSVPISTVTNNQNQTKTNSIENSGPKVNLKPDKNTNNEDDLIKSMIGCDIFQGNWVKDDSYPLYPEGSCPHIDEPFDCFKNGRPDRNYQKLRWQPNTCKIPRLNATDMLERLRGKRLVFVGDSLNRNMWESLVCTLRHSIKDKSKVFEASGRQEFRTEGSYSFLFTDYNCSVEFFRSPFLVQEWEMPINNGTKKETLRLDIIERSSPKYKDADVLIFNTGHWWTHEKTSLGKDYYQEGNHVYSELNVVDAFHKALNTWARWIDTNVNLNKTIVLFRGYSASHFSGGQWNSGGACDKETEPIKNEHYLSSYPPKMSILEDVIKKMKTPVVYLNITRMTDYRKDAHPSVYRKQSLSEEERRSPERYQDCSHWCLPGVPDSWNELVYAQILVKQYQMSRK